MHSMIVGCLCFANMISKYINRNIRYSVAGFITNLSRTFSYCLHIIHFCFYLGNTF